MDTGSKSMCYTHNSRDTGARCPQESGGILRYACHQSPAEAYTNVAGLILGVLSELCLAPDVLKMAGSWAGVVRHGGKGGCTVLG